MACNKICILVFYNNSSKIFYQKLKNHLIFKVKNAKKPAKLENLKQFLFITLFTHFKIKSHLKNLHRVPQLFIFLSSNIATSYSSFFKHFWTPKFGLGCHLSVLWSRAHCQNFELPYSWQLTYVLANYHTKLRKSSSYKWFKYKNVYTIVFRFIKNLN